MDKIVSLARRRGFVFPSSEIYGGLGSSYDYGHYGVLLKENVKARWLEAMVRERDDIVALDSSIILHPRVWEASGHVSGFTDPLVDCRFCKRRYRADHLDEYRVRGSRASTRARPRSATSPSRASSTSCSRHGSARSRSRARTPTCGRRRRRGSSSTSRTSPRSPGASRRSASRRSARRSATRSRPGTSSSARSSSSRWRWSSSCRPLRPRSGSGTGSRSG